MHYTEGNLCAEDRALRHVACSKVRTALCSIETKWTTLLDSLVNQLSARPSLNFNLDMLLQYVETHPQLRSENAEVARYTTAFPEFSDAASAALDRIRSRARRQLERALEPREYQHRFRFTKGLS